jgi:dTDP-4-dehydrorhamnose reductase
MTGAILVFGESGQVARELARQAPVMTLSRAQADLMDPAACAAAIRAHAPRAVINAAAWTAVDKAEAEEEAATVVNAHAPAAMARECASMGIPFVQLSTDYVFDGSGTAPWTPESPTGPLGAYGRSKLKGEDAVRAAGGPHVILRTSWVFSAHGANFVKTMLRLGAERPELRVVADQVGGPTPAAAIAEACLVIADRLIETPSLSGTYHFSGAPDVSWADFARAILAVAALPARVIDITSSDYPTLARRPFNSRLDCTTLAAFNLGRPSWQASLGKEIAMMRAGRPVTGAPPTS